MAAGPFAQGVQSVFSYAMSLAEAYDAEVRFMPDEFKDKLLLEDDLNGADIDG